jgi:hypothetical protein
MTVGGEHDDRARFGGDPGRARFWHWRDRAMRVIGLLLVLTGALALGLEAYGAELPVRVPILVSAIVLVFGLLVLATATRDDEP